MKVVSMLGVLVVLFAGVTCTCDKRGFEDGGKEPKADVDITAGLRITSLIYDESLADKDSPEFKKLQEEFCKSVVDGLKQEKFDEANLQIKICEVLKFINGSVIALFHLNVGLDPHAPEDWAGPDEKLIIESLVGVAYNKNGLGPQFTVDSEHVLCPLEDIETMQCKRPSHAMELAEQFIEEEEEYWRNFAMEHMEHHESLASIIEGGGHLLPPQHPPPELDCPNGRKHGESWDEGCSGCVCTDGNIACLGCPAVAALPPCYVVDGTGDKMPECCPQIKCNKAEFDCPNGKKHGEKWSEDCMNCECNEGHIQCLGCPAFAALPPCYIVDGTGSEMPGCCPQVKCPEPKPGCDNGKKDGEEWSENCQNCVCVEGDVYCTGCPMFDLHPGCVITPGKGDIMPECCPSVECNFDCKNGKKNGDKWQENCMDCFCESGETICVGCPMMDVPGPWCTISEGVGDVMPGCCSQVHCNESLHGCPNGRKNGETWTDKCTSCVCDHGIVQCKGCPDLKAPPGCFIVPPPPTDIMPDCCPQLVCEQPKDCPSGRKNGEAWTENELCIKCTCIEGAEACVGCGSVAVSEPWCEIVPGKGKTYPECCPDVECDENKFACPDGHKNGDSWTDGCTNCTCMEGKIACVGCASVGLLTPWCHTVPGIGDTMPQCCPTVVCNKTKLDCSNGKMNGESWTDGCKKCKCIEGNVECLGCPAFVPSPECRLVPGLGYTMPDCCPKLVCNETLLDCPNGKKNGESWSEDCMTCTCVEGNINCLGCPIALPGPWCEVVPGNGTTYPDCCPDVVCKPQSDCENGKNNGETWDDGCMTCSCNGGEIACLGCPAYAVEGPECTIIPGKGKTMPGCCPSIICNDTSLDCPNGKKNGATWTDECATCKCNEGKVECVGCPLMLPPGPGCKMVPGKGDKPPECCPTIDCDEAAKDDCPNGKKNWETWFDGCSKCGCRKGKVVCTGCPALEVPPGCQLAPGIGEKYPDCCSTVICKDPPFKDCANGKKDGDFWLEKCSECVCHNGEIECRGCPVPALEGPWCHVVPGTGDRLPECCPSVKCDDKATHECTLPKDTGPCKAAVKRYYFDEDLGRCQEFTYGGCEGNGNNFDSLEKCEKYCRNAIPPLPLELVCAQPMQQGDCEAVFKRYFFNPSMQKCEEFVYGGCGGNRNNFDTKELCEMACARIFPPLTPDQFCMLPRVAGPCKGAFKRFGYNSEMHTCEEFIYGGCMGNANNFDSESECDKVCGFLKPIPDPVKPLPPPEIGCKLPQKDTKCDDTLQRYFFNPMMHKCELFPRGACQDIILDFVTEAECEKTCTPKFPAPDPDTVCNMPVDNGMCKANVKRWHFNVGYLTCEEFSYTGCGGNANNFDTQIVCEKACSHFMIGPPMPPPDILCFMPAEEGPCKAAMKRFYYNPNSGCREFTYGGCHGNANNFLTEEECYRVCRQFAVTTTTKRVVEYIDDGPMHGYGPYGYGPYGSYNDYMNPYSNDCKYGKKSGENWDEDCKRCYCHRGEITCSLPPFTPPRCKNYFNVNVNDDPLCHEMPSDNPHGSFPDCCPQIVCA